MKTKDTEFVFWSFTFVLILFLQANRFRVKQCICQAVGDIVFYTHLFRLTLTFAVSFSRVLMYLLPHQLQRCLPQNIVFDV